MFGTDCLLFSQVWLTEAYFDKHLAIMSHLYDLDLAASWTGYVRGRFGMDIG